MSAVTDLEVRPITSAVGAEIAGADLCQPLPDAHVAQIRQALLDHGVVFFRGQPLDDAGMEAFVAQFGTPTAEPFVRRRQPDAPAVSTSDFQPGSGASAVWHTDTSFERAPPTLTALRAVTLPPVGGDTCWASMYAAYDALSAPMRAMLDGLDAVHSLEVATSLVRAGRKPSPAQSDSAKAVEASLGSKAPTEDLDDVRHPLVRVHPDTGRRALYYDEACTAQIVGLGKLENEAILAILRNHMKSPLFNMRWRWSPDDVALWDNRCVWHYPVPDYDAPRVMQRTLTIGERPEGPARTAA